MTVSPLTGRTQILAEHDNLEPSNRLLLSPCDVCQARTVLTFGSSKPFSRSSKPRARHLLPPQLSSFIAGYVCLVSITKPYVEEQMQSQKLRLFSWVSLEQPHDHG